MDPLLKKALRGAPPPASATCVDAERLAAWSEGSLSREEAAEVERHLSDCVRCQAMLAVFAETELPAPAAVPLWKRPVGWLVPLAAAAAVVLIWVAVARREPHAPATLEVAETATAPAAAAEPAPLQAQAPADVQAKEARVAKDKKDEAAKPEPGSQPTEPPAATPQPAAPPPAATRATPPPPPEPFRAQRPPVAQAPPAGTPPPAGTLTDALRTTDASAAAAAKTAESATGIVQIVAFADAAAPAAAPGAVTNTGAVAGGGRGIGTGAGRGGAGRPTPLLAEQVTPARWRILPSGKVERSIDAGATWDAIALESPARLTGGTAPTSTICWLIGRGGVVYRADDGVHFLRITFPVAVDLVLIRATGAAQASITTSDGRVFTTSDGGLTWLQGFPPSSF